MTAGPSKKTLCQWLDKVALQKLPNLQPDTRIWEVNTDDHKNKYSYLYNVYFEDLAKEPIGVIFYKDKFHQFFHSTTTGNPYLGPTLKEVNQYEFQDNASTEEEEQGAKERLTLQICNLMVKIDQGQPGSPERSQEPWAPDRTPTIDSATTAIPLTTYPTQQTQPWLPMATETISRTLTESAPQHEATQELAQPPEGSRQRTGSIPFGADQLGSSQYSNKQVHAAITNTFRRHLRPQETGGGGGGGDPPSDDEFGGGSSDEEPDGNHLQDLVPIP